MGAALRLVGLGDHAGYGEAFPEQSAKRGDGELRCPEEDDPHQSVDADSGSTSLVYPVSSLCSLRHFARSICRLMRLR